MDLLKVITRRLNDYFEIEFDVKGECQRWQVLLGIDKLISHKMKQQCMLLLEASEQ